MLSRFNLLCLLDMDLIQGSNQPEMGAYRFEAVAEPRKIGKGSGILWILAALRCILKHFPTL